PPFATARYPALGPSLLAAACERDGIRCSVTYANVMLAARMGLERYEHIADSSSVSAAGERLFAAAAFGTCPLPDGYEDLAVTLDEFVYDVTQQIVRGGAKIIGFSSSFQQNSAAVAIARALKSAAPDRITLFGGANADAPMGEALADVAGCFDVVVSGEADELFTELCRKLLAGRVMPRVICGLPVQRLDDLPVPRYDDYFTAIAAFAAAPALPASLPFESSRGCWWGQKKHCTFCGLNAGGMAYRRKSGERLIGEIEQLVTRYGTATLHAADNILPLDLTGEVLPWLAARQPRLDLFYEVKANVRPAMLDLFVRAGINSIQPGIESLADRVLQRMDKGVSAAQNIALLRDCASRQIDVNWNLLVDVPGDEADDYAAMSALVPSLEHLQPPSGCTPVLIDRYSPYFTKPEAFGITDVRPLPVYASIYPVSADLSRLAYHFRGTFSTGGRSEAACALADAVDRWKSRWSDPQCPALMLVELESGAAAIVDSRESRYGAWTLLTSEQ
ncbi:MAG TPA: RiPP maturation radical SAM C-methyltransferase, partial [Thermoanaerobaculia bacterium]|nr:RiPP maturation radical SAM C-methyltransferase [Thermoanaerobaculia bacterium]